MEGVARASRVSNAVTAANGVSCNTSQVETDRVRPMVRAGALHNDASLHTGEKSDRVATGRSSPCSPPPPPRIENVNYAQGTQSSTHLLSARVALLRWKGRGEEEVHRHLEGVADRQVRLSLLLLVAFSLLVPKTPPPGAAHAPPPLGAAAAAFPAQLGD